MKKNILRQILLILFISLALLNFSSSAQSASLSLSVSNTLKAGKTFEVTVSSPIPLCAIELDVRYDAGALAYKSAKAALSAGEIRTRETADGVRLIYACAGAKDGALLRLSFKALANTDTEILFTPLSAAISDEELYDFESSITLTLSIGDSASFRSRTTPKSTSASSSESSQDLASDSGSSPNESSAKEISGFYSKTDHLPISLIGGGAAALGGTALAIGFRLGKRVKKTNQPPPGYEIEDKAEKSNNGESE